MQDAIGYIYNIAQSNVIKWLGQRLAIFESLASAEKGDKTRVAKLKTVRYLKLGSRAGKYAIEETSLIEELRRRRKVGKKVSGTWLKRQMKSELLKTSPNCPFRKAFRCSDGWLHKFCKRHSIAYRCKSNSKSMSITEREPYIARYFARREQKCTTLQEGGCTTYGGLEGEEKKPIVFHEKWGRHLPQYRLNTDQVPMPLCKAANKTWEFRGERDVRIGVGKGADEKRFCTLQVTARPVNDRQPRVTIVFRGGGKRLSNIEKASWDPRCTVLFQGKAWMDESLCLAWAVTEVPSIIKDIVGNLNEDIEWTFDNLHGQKTPKFIEALRTRAGAKVDMLPEGQTDLVQFIDANVGKTLKDRAHKLLED